MEVKVERIMNNLPKKLFSLIKSQTGFSLAEVMVAAGVAGTLALGTLQLASLHTRSQLTDDLISAQQAVQTVMKNSNSCSWTVAGTNVGAFSPYDGSVSTSIALNSIRKHNAVTNSGDVWLPRSPLAANISPANESTVDRSSNYVVFGGTVMVKSINISNIRTVGGRSKTAAAASSLSRSGVGELEIVFAIKDTTKPAGSKIKEVTKHILFPVTFSQGGVIEDCKSPEDIGVQETEEEMCTTLGGSFVGDRCVQVEEVLTDSLKLKTCTDLGGSFNNADNSCIPPWVGCFCNNTPTDFIRGFSPSTGKPFCASGAPPTGCKVP